MIRRYCRLGAPRAVADALLAEGRSRVDQAAVVANPTASVEHSRSLDAAEDSETIAGISIPLGIGGRRFLLSDAADERLGEKRAEGNLRLLDSALDLRELLVRTVAESARSAVLEKQLAVLEALGESVAGLKSGSESSAHDVLRAELELEVLRTRFRLQRSRAASSEARLAAYVSGEVALSGFSLMALASEPAPANTSPHPALARIDASIRASELETAAAYRLWVPDLEVFFGYRHVTALADDTGHGFALRVALPITFFDHGQGQASMAEAATSAARAERAAIVTAKQAEEQAAVKAIAELGPPSPSDDASARAEKLLAQSKELYLAGEGSMAELASASKLVEDAALARIDLEEARALARVARMRALGSLFDPALDRACQVQP